MLLAKSTLPPNAVANPIFCTGRDIVHDLAHASTFIGRLIGKGEIRQDDNTW
jgi:hypothetical protein